MPLVGLHFLLEIPVGCTVLQLTQSTLSRASPVGKGSSWDDRKKESDLGGPTPSTTNLTSYKGSLVINKSTY